MEASTIELVRITIADMQFTARLEHILSPMTCKAFCAALPFHAKLIQARWSGEAGWIPLPGFDLGVEREGATGSPDVGHILFHPADHCECEILIPYGKSAFRCKDGALVGNHFLTIVEGKEQLSKLGELILWHGSQEIVFSRVS